MQFIITTPCKCTPLPSVLTQSKGSTSDIYSSDSSIEEVQSEVYHPSLNERGRLKWSPIICYHHSTKLPQTSTSSSWNSLCILLLSNVPGFLATMELVAVPDGLNRRMVMGPRFEHPGFLLHESISSHMPKAAILLLPRIAWQSLSPEY